MNKCHHEEEVHGEVHDQAHVDAVRVDEQVLAATVLGEGEQVAVAERAPLSTCHIVVMPHRALSHLQFFPSPQVLDAQLEVDANGIL
jgi:hypothetical protein